MLRWMLLGFLCIKALLPAQQRCSCGVAQEDPFYAKALSLLNETVRQEGLYREVDFPSLADVFYPPLELREELDDTYLYEGTIYWETTQRCYWDKDFNPKGTPGDFFLDRSVVVPIKMRRVKSFDESTWEEKSKFDFQKNYATLAQAFRCLESDIDWLYEKNREFLSARIKDVKRGYPVYEWGEIAEKRVDKNRLLEVKRQLEQTHLAEQNRIASKKAEAFLACTQSLDLCIAQHQNLRSRINRGLFYYWEGESLDALDQIKAALQTAPKTEIAQIKEEALILKGQTEIETGLYVDAVLTLTGLISQNPFHKQAYFERATAYFELGSFDLSLEDYLTSHARKEFESSCSKQITSFAKALTQGIVQGGSQAVVEFIPSLFSSLQGISHGLFAFAQDPIHVTSAFAQAAKACVQFIQHHTPQEVMSELVPELKDLILDWDQLTEEQRGEATGYIIGKYGIDIFAGVGVTKAISSYRALKKANNLLTFEAMALSKRNKAMIQLEAAKRAQQRKALLKHANLKVQWDKQGKHIVDHANYEILRKRSVLQHPDPQSLADRFAGIGMRMNSHLPGTPGYQELVNFKEVIGYVVEQETGEKLMTSWGKIHYAKDGVHIVPTKPR